jgi:hypothetical protein
VSNRSFLQHSFIHLINVLDRIIDFFLVTSDQRNEEGETELLNTFSSSSSSRKTATRNSISPSAELDLYHDLNSEISMTSESNQMQNYEFDSYSSKPQSTNRRLYIRSIVRHMLSDDTSDEERY